MPNERCVVAVYADARSDRAEPAMAMEMGMMIDDRMELSRDRPTPLGQTQQMNTDA